MNSKSLRQVVQKMKSSRVRYAVIFASLVLILIIGAVQASGPMRPPHPPMPPQNDGMWGMNMPSWGMQMPKWPPWQQKPWHPRPWYPPQPVPKIHIYMVLEDQGVVIETEDFPENENFTVTMGEMYTRGVDGIVVGSFNSGDGSSQLLGFRLPEELQGENRVAIRAQSDHDYPYYFYAFNWFFNADYIPTVDTLETTAASATEMFDEALAATEGAVAPPKQEGSEETPAAEETSEETPAETESAEEGVGGMAELTGAAWQWTGFSDPEQGDLTVDAPEQYTVEFMPDGLVAVKADCNNGSGTYITDEEGGIDIAIGIVTLAACAPESLSDQFLQYLGEVAVYSFDENGNLILDLPVDTGTMVFMTGDADEGEAEVPAEEEGAAEASVTGTVTYLPRIALPDDAVVSVQIYNAQLADATEVLGEQVIETGGQQVPIPYEVAYNPEDINENMMYSVSARIEDGEGNLLFISDTVTPVITNGNPTEDVEIMTIPVEASEEAEAPTEEEAEAEEAITLTGVVWNWAEFTDPVQGSLEIEDPSMYTVEFFEDGTVGIKADCNNGSGSYVADEDGAIDVTVGAVTLALCAEDSLSDQFIQYLDAAAIYFFENGDLLLDLPVDSGTLRFAAAAEAEAGATAKLASIALMPVAGGGGEDEEVVEESPVPSFTICVVDRDETVSIVGENFPADQTFAVKMGVAQTYMPMPKHPMPPKPMPYQGPMKPPMGKPSMGPPKGQPGGMWMKPTPKVWIPYYEAGTLKTGDGGDVAATFDIPAELAGAYKISIMMRTDHQFPYISYNWFYNNDADVCNGQVNND